MKTLALMISAIGLIAFNPRLAYSCSCVNIGSPREELKKAKAVFVGEVIQIYSGSGDKEYLAVVELKVERYWKGVKRSETIEVLSDLGTRSCGIVPLKGKYLVYAYKRGKNLITHGCTRTKKVEDAAEDLRELGEGKMLKAAKQNSGLHPQRRPTDCIRTTPRHEASHGACAGARVMSGVGRFLQKLVTF